MPAILTKFLIRASLKLKDSLFSEEGEVASLVFLYKSLYSLTFFITVASSTSDSLSDNDSSLDSIRRRPRRRGLENPGCLLFLFSLSVCLCVCMSHFYSPLYKIGNNGQ